MPHSAIGLLFLSGGKATLSRSNSAIAALVTAFFPLYPNSTTDNKYHLQATRHLYVLAIENRYISVYDVDSGEPCYVNLEISLKETLDHGPTVLHKVAPCLVPEYDSIKYIKCKSDRYWPITLQSHAGILPLPPTLIMMHSLYTSVS
jgi:anaphase-promoting complex subunit 1